MINIKKILPILLIFVISFSTKAPAELIFAKTCSKADVQFAIDRASSGDTIFIPAGRCEWTEKIMVPDEKRIIIKGAGNSSTVIEWKGANEAIDLGRSGSRLTSLKIIISYGSNNFGVHVYGHGWRIDHCEFENWNDSNREGIFVRGTSTCYDPTGLIDNCVFINARVLVFGNANLRAYESWYADYKLGSKDFVFIEDCIFTRTIFGNSVDSHYGGNYVFRYNTIINSSVEVHSNTSQDGSSNRAGRLWEIYENKFLANIAYYTPFRLRGGTGVVFNNKVSGIYSDPNILIDNVRTYEGYCISYPCQDQIGRGRDEWLWTNENPFPPQTLEPAYQWNNVYADKGVSIKFKVINSCENVLKEGRDFYNAQKPGYIPYPYPHPMRQLPSAPGNLRIIN